MSKLEATRGLWIGLGIALVLMALFAPVTITVYFAQQSQQECIKARGDWNNQTNECKFKEK